MTDLPPEETIETNALDFAGWYTNLQAKAGEKYHQIRVIVAPGGEVTTGQQFTLKPFEAEAKNLEDALTTIESYLDSDRAKNRGDMFRERDTAKAEVEAAQNTLRELQTKLRNIGYDIEDDLAEALEDDYSGASSSLGENPAEEIESGDSTPT